MSGRPTVAISLGDPGGIGPELTARVLAEPPLVSRCVPVVYGAEAVWARACAIAGVADTLARVASGRDAGGPSLVACDVAPLSELPLGQSSLRGGLAQMRYLARAVDELVAGAVEGLVTAPVSKAAILGAGQPFVGHTEYLQERLGAPRTVMFMAGERLSVALATTHVAVSEVPRRLDASELAETLVLTAKELQARFGLAAPRLAVCGLNPHAGERGAFGDEESRIILPAMEAARSRGVECEGPFAADGLFARVDEAGFDAVVAMYHDQGLIPFKMREFATGVNVTLGLPRPRTSPDHGVAYDLAGSGKADHRSLAAALSLCIRLCSAGPGAANPPTPPSALKGSRL